MSWPSTTTQGTPLFVAAGSACTTTCLAGWAMSTDAVVLQALRDDPQEDAQHPVEHCPVALHEIAQMLQYREHPVAHWQAGENMIAEVRRCLHHVRI